MSGPIKSVDPDLMAALCDIGHLKERIDQLEEKHG